MRISELGNSVCNLRFALAVSAAVFVPPAAVADEIVHAVRLFSAVPSQSSSAFRNAQVPELQVDTTSFDRTPYRLARLFEGTILAEPGARISLAGDEAGSTPWSVDNFLFIEIGSEPPRRIVVGAVDPVRYRGMPVEQIASGFTFAAGQIDLTPYLPVGKVTPLRILALDYGGTGHLSDVFLIVASPVREPEVVALSFVREEAENTIPLDFLRYGDPFLLEVRFDSAPDEAEQVVALEWEGGAREVTVHRTVEDPRLFRSENVLLRPLSDGAVVEP